MKQEKNSFQQFTKKIVLFKFKHLLFPGKKKAEQEEANENENAKTIIQRFKITSNIQFRY